MVELRVFVVKLRVGWRRMSASRVGSSRQGVVEWACRREVNDKEGRGESLPWR